MTNRHAFQLLIPGIASLLVTSEGILLLSGGAHGQIVPDVTLGAESSVLIPGDVVDRIEGGATRGSALFHSFLDFNVDTGQQVYFANPSGIEAILSRVTGLNPSQIDGLLGVDGAANLFFINPNGILFGPDAQLDVEGAFLASTSDRFRFADGSEFRATDPNEAPLVTVNIPLGLQLGPNAPAALTSKADLMVGGDLTLSAGRVTSTGLLSAPNGTVRVEGLNGDVQVQAVEARSAILSASETLMLEDSRLVTQGDLSLLAEETVRIRDSVETPFLAAAGGDLRVQGNNSIDILALNHLDMTPFQAGGNLTLASDGPISGDAHFTSWGNFSIEDLSGHPGSFVSYYDPIISAYGNVEFGDYEGVALKVEATGSIHVDGNVTITGPDIMLGTPNAVPILDTDIPVLNSSAALILRAGVDSSAVGNTTNDIVVPPVGSFGGATFQPVNSPIIDLSTGNALPAGSLLIEGDLNTTGAPIVAPSYVQNGYTAGPIILSATGDIVVDGSTMTSVHHWTTDSNSGALSMIADGSILLRNGRHQGRPKGEGSGGNITLQGREVTLRHYELDPASLAVGSSGGTVITATDGDIFLASSTIQGDNYSNQISGGDESIYLEGRTITLDDSFLNTGNFGGGEGASVFLNATGDITVKNSSYISSTNSSDINTDQGIGGNIFFNAGQHINVQNSIVSADNSGLGIGGSITLNAGQNINVQMNSKITAKDINNSVPGTSGDITVATGDTLTINDSRLLTDSILKNAGLVFIEVGNLRLTNSTISSSTQFGVAGDIVLTAWDSLILSGASSDLIPGSNELLYDAISAIATDGGTGGSITLNTHDLHVQNGAAVTVSSFLGEAGNLTITAGQITLNQGSLTAVSGQGDGGANITIDPFEDTHLTNFVRLQNGSLISASAQDNATGGNISINANFIFGDYPTDSHGSDIIANAQQGNGGVITIDAPLGVFGLQFRSEQTPLNDITANSQTGTQGVVAVNTLAADPTSGLAELAFELIDTSDLPVNQCAVGSSSEASEITNAGRGGLPPMPTTILEAISPDDHWVTLDDDVHREENEAGDPHQSMSSPLQDSDVAVAATGVDLHRWQFLCDRTDPVLRQHGP